LFEGVTVLFLAQFYGVDLALSQQILVAFICVRRIGTAGVPAGCSRHRDDPRMIGVPPKDRARTRRRSLPRHVPHHANVTGDLAAAVVVSAASP
jgi:DAACS family dicarboxylate/amino acid:cation (Na+ or H+) symporter